ncbi:MAG: glutamine amidotransferase [candidate division KSB1 bacterium]|nr:glutamine amidotransferase [candidate division KSB1 bacterium]MDZ7272859.1 glutamine amidotransferase [candidate division KSB1 bacterium]MDZ7284118.1 glutamine amidotransferase [candidate division KSB1 bacterium]MDZ7297484.1 glutamine amidotransferase [candidate division KSB1 bacterium]MDZ7305620.1 glutamine amidotransferase [candidate division KSB1 bacterium]
MFDFLFKYSPVVYEQGRWLLRGQPSLLALLLGVALLLVLVWLAYRRTTAPLLPRWRAGLMLLRLAALALLAFCLLEPALSVTTVVSQKSSVLLLLDNSQSMAIADGSGGRRRIDQIAAWLGEASQANSMRARLQQNFRLEVRQFSSAVAPLPDAGQLQAGGASTNLAHALEYAGRQAQLGTLSGVVLVSDGAASAGADPLSAARALVAAKVPLFTVGVGTKISKDVQIAKVDAARLVLENAMVEVNTLIQARGYAGRQVEVELREGDTVIKRQPLVLQERSTRATLQFAPPQPGFAHYRVSLPQLPGELVTANNHKSFLLDSRNRLGRVLYVEELHPWEYKFIARAVAGDPALQLTSLLKTGTDKFLRLGLRHGGELAGGFPKSRSELFGYQAVVLGSMPASFFSTEQLQLLTAFVAERGGGFLMLGGRHAFGQGEYQRTPVADLLPVELPPFSAADGRAIAPQLHEEFRFTPTAEYLTRPLLQLDADPVKNAQMWEKLPLLQGYNPLGPAKPGATVLAVHPLHRPESPRILLATQRYGRGRTAVLATSSTWRWQMHLDHRDQTHERFWRQLLHWLSLQSPDPVTVELDRESFSPGEDLTLHIEVRDSAYVPVAEAGVSVKITAPDGEVVTLNASPDLSAGGARYAARYQTTREGLHTVEVFAYHHAGQFLGRAETAFLVEPSQAELANADLQTALLQRLAEITGGRYFHIDQSQDLPDAITVARSSFAKLTEHDIWDAPIFFLLLVALLASEWFLRRSRGLS